MRTVQYQVHTSFTLQDRTSNGDNVPLNLLTKFHLLLETIGREHTSFP